MTRRIYKKPKAFKVFLYCLRRVLWDPSFVATFFAFSLLFALFLYFAVSSPKPNGPAEAYDLEKILRKIASYQSLPSSEENAKALSYLCFLRDHPMSTGNYAIYGFEGVFGERVLTQETAFRFLLYLPVFLLPLNLLSAYALFGGEGANNDAKNLSQAMLTPGNVRRGKMLFHLVFSLLLYIAFSSLSFVLQRKGLVMYFTKGNAELTDSLKFLYFVYFDGFLATLLFYSYSLFLAKRISSPIDFGIASGLSFFLFFGFTFFAWAGQLPFQEYVLLTFGSFEVVSNPLVLLYRYIPALLVSALFLFLFRLRSEKKS